MNTPHVCPPRWGGGFLPEGRTPRGADGPVPHAKAPLPAAVERGAGRAAGNRKRSGSRTIRPDLFVQGGAARSGEDPGARRESSKRRRPQTRGMGGVPLGRVPSRPSSGAGRDAGRVRGAKAPGPAGGPHAKPQHTPGRGYGGRGGQEGRPDEGHSSWPARQGEGRVLPVGAGAYPAGASRGAGPAEGRGGTVPVARRAAVHRMPAPSDDAVPSHPLRRTAFRRAASNRTLRSPGRGDR